MLPSVMNVMKGVGGWGRGPGSGQSGQRFDCHRHRIRFECMKESTRLKCSLLYHSTPCAMGHRGAGD